MFDEFWTVQEVADELDTGHQKDYNVPDLSEHNWVQIVTPKAVPSEWFSTDLGKGELFAMALAIENPDRIVLLDDGLARRISKAAGLKVWGTLKILLEAKQIGLVQQIGPLIDSLAESGMWLSSELKTRIKILAGE